ncbi:MAG: restriction endonuclease subunit S [Thiobacillus sp.]
MKAQEKSADYLVSSQATEWLRGTLGELLPIKYGKSLPEKLRDTTGSHPVFGSSGLVGTHSAALTAGPTLIIGRKGNVGAIHYSSDACWPIDTVYYVEPPEGQNLRYYKYLLESLNLVKLDKSTAVPGLSRDDYNAVEVVVAPPNQQDGIVAEIEKQFSRLDEAVANLKRVKANLKRYKAAVLKAAVEGRLVETEAERARREGRSYETGAQLLQRILETRRSQWKGKGKYKEPAAPDTTDLPELPEGWMWASVDQLVAHLTDGDHQAPPQTDQGIPFLVIGNVRSGEIDFSDTRFVGEAYYKSLDPSRQPRIGDLLYTLVGSYGIPVRVTTEKPFCIQRHMAILRPHEHSPMSYLTVAMGSDNVFKQATAVATGTAQLTVPLAGLRRIATPLPPISEQERIVAEVERRLTLLCATEAQVEANLQRAQLLRQSVLSKAFTGTSIEN